MGQAGTSSSFFGVGIDPSNKWVLWLRPSDGPVGAPAATAASGPSVGVWTHLVAVYDAATGQGRLYVNGVQAATVTMNTPWNATGSFLIGRGQYGGSVAHLWRGDIDDVRVFRGVLSGAQIAYLTSI